MNPQNLGFLIMDEEIVSESNTFGKEDYTLKD